MELDKFSQPIFKSQDLFELLYEHGPGILHDIIVEEDTDINWFSKHAELILNTVNNISYSQTISEFDKNLQEQWFMPEDYKQLDIESYLVNICPKENYSRLIEELQEFRNRNMLDLLRWLKYFVDTCRAKNIVWGVGRGSSVASYVLYLIGVHKINSLKYNLDWREFLR